MGAVVGDEIWDQQSRIRVKMGPLTQEQYLSFLPGGSAYEPLREMSRVFLWYPIRDRGAADSEAGGGPEVRSGRRQPGGTAARMVYVDEVRAGFRPGARGYGFVNSIGKVGGKSWDIT